jgi:hypothetical protein
LQIFGLGGEAAGTFLTAGAFLQGLGSIMWEWGHGSVGGVGHSGGGM